MAPAGALRGRQRRHEDSRRGFKEGLLFWKKAAKNFLPRATAPIRKSLFASFSPEKEGLNKKNGLPLTRQAAFL
jgi:hypothetical protein